jgi:hypothetical protein
VSANVDPSAFPQAKTRLVLLKKAPPVGFEPTLTAPEAVALSPELWGLRDVGKSTSERALPGHAAVPRLVRWSALPTSRRGQPPAARTGSKGPFSLGRRWVPALDNAPRGAITGQKTLPSRE